MVALGASPFIVPAMGSHGGGTAEGQAGILAEYGITEETVGAPVKSSMEVVEIDVTDFGMPVYFDKYASEADHVVVVNRVKPHTGFVGEIESGLMKMMLIGLGKHKGRNDLPSSHHPSLVRQDRTGCGQVRREKMPITFGVALLENGYDETAQIAAVPLPNSKAPRRRFWSRPRPGVPACPSTTWTC